MKIMSLNVNQFQVVRLSTGAWSKEIIACVKEFLSKNSDGLVFLYEIPKRFYKTEELENELKPYKIEYSGPKRTIHTIAIKGNARDWKQQPSSIWGEDYINRYVELVNADSGLKVLGIHAPLRSQYNTHEDVEEFFNKLKEYADKNRATKLIILGDMNVHSKEPCTYYTIFNTIRTLPPNGGLGYSDKVKDGEITHFPTGHTIDHVLVSPALKDKVTAEVKSQSDLELSDHAVIIVNVEI